MDLKIRKAADAVVKNVLPDKSRDKYLEVYNKFMEWKKYECIDASNCSETVLLAYFSHLSKTYKPSSLWAFYSMLKAAIETNHNVNIKYNKLISFLRKTAVGHIAKKSNVFTRDEVNKFLTDAQDNEFLVVKVVLVFGVYGATRGDELTKLTLSDVMPQGNIFLIKIRETKTHVTRKFTIDGEYTDYIRRYLALRPLHTTTNRFFLNFRNGKCTVQPIGKNKFHAMPKIIATFLEFPDPKSYTGHSFRRTSATLLSNGGGSMTELMRLGGGGRRAQWMGISKIRYRKNKKSAQLYQEK